jgi:hypothetical protein
MDSLYKVRMKKLVPGAVAFGTAALLLLNACSKPETPAVMTTPPAATEAKPVVSEVAPPPPPLAVEVAAAPAAEPAPGRTFVEPSGFAPMTAPASFAGKMIALPAIDESQPFQSGETPQTRFTARVEAMKEMRLEQAQAQQK